MRAFPFVVLVSVGLAGAGCSAADKPGTGPAQAEEAGLADHVAGDAQIEVGGSADAGDLEGSMSDEASGNPAESGFDAGGDATPPDATLNDAGVADAPPMAATDSPNERTAPPPVCAPACQHGVCVESSGSCACDPGWAGAPCDVAAPMPAPGTPVAGTVTQGQWAYFNYGGLASGLSATLTEDATVGLVWLYLGTGVTPDRSSHLSANEDTQSGTHTVSHTFASPGTQMWYVAAYGQPAIAPSTQAVPFHVTLTVIP